MATVVNFHGKNCIEPGSYAATVRQDTSVVNVAQFGNVMIIDTGLALNTYNGVQYEFAGGSGIKGELAHGLKSVYEFSSIEDFVSFMGGGLVADIAKKIFTPRDGVAGAPKLYYTRAATTTAAKITLTFAEGQSLILTCKNEGLCGNGKLANPSDASSVLKAGYSARVIAGEIEDTFRLQIFKGTFAGVDKDGEPFGNYEYENAIPDLIAESDDLTTLGELFAWCKKSKDVNAHFVVSKPTTATDATELIAVTQTVATGGTTSYLNDGEYSEVLESISELQVSFFLCTNLNADEGAGVDSATNGALFTAIKNKFKYDEHMIVAGGEEDDDIFGESNCSQAIAKYFNSDQVVVVHGAPVVPRKDKNGNKQLNAIYNAAAITGLVAGGAPQTPLTFKRAGYDSYAYDLKQKEREKALQAGILHMRIVSGYMCINQGITTLQDNLRTISDDAQSFEFSVSLIKAQINKELIIDGQLRFTGQTAAQSDPESVKNFTETKLASLVAKKGEDNLIISWKNVKVRANNSDYFINYDFVPNVPVNKTFFTGNMLDFKTN